MRAWEAFDGVWSRVRRATTHREAAARGWSKWLEEYEPFGPSLHVDEDGNGTLTIRQFSPVPPVIAIEIGEWLYNLRAALDGTVYALAIHHAKQDPPPDEHLLQFPLYDTKDKFRDARRCIRGLSDRHQAWIESMQPYAHGAVLGQTAMYWVNELARIDRHRRLQVVGGFITESDPIISFDADEGAVFYEDVDPFVFVETGDDGEGEAVIARFKVVPASLHDRVQANPQTAIEPDILEMARRRPPDVAWLRFPLSKRLFLIEAMVEANIGLFENDCIGWTQSKYFDRHGGKDPSGDPVRRQEPSRDDEGGG